MVAPEEENTTVQQPIGLEELAAALEAGDLSPSEALRTVGEEIGALRDEAQPLRDTLEAFELTEKRYRAVAERAMRQLRQSRQIGALHFEWVEPGRSRQPRRTFVAEVVEEVIVTLRSRGVADLAEALDLAGKEEKVARPHLRISPIKPPKETVTTSA